MLLREGGGGGEGGWGGFCVLGEGAFGASFCAGALSEDVALNIDFESVPRL